jgi:two-component system, OmpR family, phosphate regulon sensor histidine kinase PhoR
VARRSLIWRFYPSFLVITAVSLLAVGWYASQSARNFYYQRATDDLEVRACLLENDVRNLLSAGDLAGVDLLCKKQGKCTGTRFTVMLPSGRVVGDSDEDPRGMENHATRPEMVQALNGEVGKATRRSATLRQDMRYVAFPLKEKGRVVAVLRTSFSLYHVEELLGELYRHIALGGFAIALLGAVVSFGVYRRIARPLEEIRRGAERFARGELGAKIPILDPDEVGSLAMAMNEMAQQLDDRIRTITRQRNEQEAALSSMVEGVLAVDMKERLITINQAAARILGVAREQSRGRTVREVVRNTELQKFVEEALAADNPQEESTAFRESGNERFLQLHGAALRDALGNRIGAVIVLNDITRLRRLENLRRDFVANVSHELKTPITSIKGFVETLQEGAIENPEEARQFLDVVAKHADRLNTIIEDLLLLSRIEQDAERATLEKQETALRDVLREAAEACAVKAAAKHIAVEIVCPDDLSARVNMQLCTQAVINLIDNAVKYSGSGSSVRVEATDGDGEVTISVHDHGCGIAPEHLARLGERFYRVDKARSRKEGGTGLGLAIVKHIVEAHGGSLSVQSVAREGSCFRIVLPIRDPHETDAS